MLPDLAANAHFHWTRILAVDQTLRRDKPDPAVYAWAVQQLEVPASEVIMVAAHAYELRAAAQVGFRTAFVDRPLEFGDPPSRPADLPAWGDRLITGFSVSPNSLLPWGLEKDAGRRRMVIHISRTQMYAIT